MPAQNLASVVRKIQVVKNNITFEIYPWNHKGLNPLEEFRFIQDINSLSLGGHLIIKDVYNWSGSLNLIGTEKLIVEFFSDITYVNTKTIEFKIFSIEQVSNTAINLTMNESEFYNIIKIDFSTDNITAESYEYDILGLGDDFVGYIATDGSGEIPGFINEIFNKLGIDEFEIEPSYNGVWVRSNELTYPWAKHKGQIDIESLLRYITQYSVSKDNKNAVNYFLWRDIDGYHFKSVEKMITEPSENSAAYVFTSETTPPYAVKAVYQMSESNILKLSDENVFQSFYEKISPNYDEFYLDFVDNGLSYKYEIVDFDYHRDFSTWRSIESNKLLPDSVSTSVYSNKKLLQNLKVDDNVYGYFDKSKLNTPFPQSWDHIGKTADSRWNDINFIPQYDMTELDIKTFHTIHKKIREPLRQKRVKYSYLKNLKRKWEVYRCSICCLSDRLGGIKDQQDIEAFQNIENPSSNPDFKLLFGPTGIFNDLGVQYNIVAAGSFSDVYNYDEKQIDSKGITLSYDLNSSPYNETIADFYHIGDMKNYRKYVIDYGLEIYKKHIEEHERIISIIDDFLIQVPNFINIANTVFQSQFEPFEESYDGEIPARENQLAYIITPRYNTFYPMLAPPNTEEKEEFAIPYNLYKVCSSHPYIPGGRGSQTEDYTYLVNYSTFSNQRFNKYFKNIANFYANPNDATKIGDGGSKDVIVDKTYVCSACTNSISLEIIKNQAIKEKSVRQVQIKLLKYILDELTAKFNTGQIPGIIVGVSGEQELYFNNISNYLQKPAFFISNRGLSFENNLKNNSISSNLSLFNIKSITRKPIRGSRYEILAKSKGINDNVEEYLYNIFFENETSIDGEGNHPYYDQTYKQNLGNSSFVDLPKVKKIKSIEKYRTSTSNITSQFAFPPSSVIGGGIERAFIPSKENQISSSSPLLDEGYVNSELRAISSKIENFDENEYIQRFNIFKTNLVGKKPPNLKREEISSYIRIEFKQPIGIESLADFPKGFIRNAGHEYFLPYLISLTSGPNGRQTINQNLTVIGMDPYGFDVAMKRIVDQKNTNGEYYWWYNGSSSPGMFLWSTLPSDPTVYFETKYTYYTAHIPNKEFIYSDADLLGIGGFNDSPSYVNDYYSVQAQYNIPSNISNVNTETFINLTKESLPTSVINEYEHKGTNQSNSKYNKDLSCDNYASNYLMESHKVIKAIRNYWSFNIPDNIKIIPYFKFLRNDDITYDYGTFNLDRYNSDFVFTDESHTSQFNNYFYFGYGAYWGNYFNNSYETVINYEKLFHDCYLKLLDSDDVYNDVINPLLQNNLKLVLQDNAVDETVSIFKDEIDFNNTTGTYPEFKNYFGHLTNFWFRDLRYDEGIVTEEIWKYDLSGYSEYGIVLPPVNANHPDIFDHNFAGQFVVFAKSTDVCKKNNLKCINPSGSTVSSGCPPENPYCNCPAQNRKPTEAEPSYLELYKLEQELKECSLIQEHLGEEWLGCVWSNPENTASCNCPEVGEKFMKYLEYSRTYATFWNTPPKTPLLRNAQIKLLFSSTLQIKVQANPALKVGDVVALLQPNTVQDDKNQYKRFTGRYLVTSINYIFNNNAVDYYELTLNRDTPFLNPNEASNPFE